MGERESTRLAKDCLETRANGKSTINGEHRIEVGATIKDPFRQVASERGGPGKAGRGGCEMHRRVAWVPPDNGGEVL